MSHRLVGASLAAALGLLTGLQAGPAAAPPAGTPATGTGCGTGVGRVVLDTTYNPATGRYELNDSRRGNHRTYDLAGATGGTGTLVTDDDNDWCDASGRGADAVAAHYLHAVTWDYFAEVHGRKGLRGDGRGGCSRVHHGRDHQNVFFADGCLTYGDRSDWRHPLTRIDIAAHEWAHVVTEATANLRYSGESGGLNEATSDIFAAAVEFRAKNPADPGDYLVDESLSGVDDGVPLRYMDRPSRDGRSKDYWYPGIGGTDVHYSSGPANHFFYLLSEGSGKKVVNGVTYDSPTYDGKPVTGIGRSAAERVWYRALTQRMSTNTDYKGARGATLTAAAELYGQGSAEHRAVDAAWAAVNVT
ncbi:M4 family metallopeptidase [Streptomyces sp. I05A-00742]|uniref:M4 family metallopeptidase n=1 Tax=Streptomyces sp. I05A-00742 TaxID=2732853 RepID=UPI0014890383|nr:M4 family metallopeptidase [Streptomyces sp. I05A-00742]